MNETQTPVASTEAPVAKKAPPKPKTKPAPAAKKAPANGDLTGNEVKILKALAKSPKPLTRNDLRSKTGIQKGYSKVLGASTNGSDPSSLEGRKLIRVLTIEDVRGMSYEITATGRKALEKAEK